MKRHSFFTRAAATAAAVCILSVSAFAASVSGSGVVHCGTYLNVRTAGNTGAPVIGKIYSGTAVTVLSSVNGWYKISYNGSTAWVSGLYVTMEQKGQIVADAAKAELGVKYVFDGASPSAGFDCSGLTLYACAKVGVTLPHSSAQQALKGTAVARSALKPGDLVFFDTDGGNNAINHVGVYVGNNTVVQAESGVGKVAAISLTNSFWSAAYMSARRVV